MSEAGEVASTAPEGAVVEGSAAPTKPEVTGWQKDLPEEMQGNDSIQNFQDVGQLTKSFIELKAMQGSSIHMLGEDASDEQRQAQAKEIMEKIPGYMPKPNFEDEDQANTFWSTLGKPENKEGYTMPEGAGAEQWQEGAFQADMTDGQSQKLFKYFQGLEDKQAETAMAAHNEAVGQLKTDWGQAYPDKYKQAAHMAGQMAEKIGFAGDANAFKEGVASPQSVRMYSAIFDMIGGEGADFVKEDGGSKFMTPGEAQSKIDAINNNPKHPYWDKTLSHEEKQRQQQNMQKLLQARKEVA